MYKTLSLKMLTEAGLTPDWMTLYIGWRGIELPWGETGCLPFADVQVFACDQLAAAVETESEDVIFRIINADRVDEVEKQFSEFAGTTWISEEVAHRKWLLAILFRIVPDITTQYDFNERLDLGYYTGDLLSQYSELSLEKPPLDMPYNWMVMDNERAKSEFGLWLDSERTAILAIQERVTVK